MLSNLISECSEQFSSHEMEEEVEGPDRVLLCDYWVTHLAEGTVKLRKIPGYPGDKEPMSLITYIKKQCQVVTTFK